eukprot:gb/GECH01011722.1/.p1 GENE.gb/GECH01011722.1/~~gb/GECH01011722.1/.p1  ORF type:complete len:363 (+),score=95.13 gb/GECH01011722.1/:1-1089(+)
MKVLALLVGILLLASWASALAPEDPHDGVIDITPSNFDTVIGKDANVLVEFYAPWCGHCKRLAETYGKLGEVVSKSKSKDSFKIAKLNADEHKDLAAKFDVGGFPTLKFFPAGSDEPEEYTSGRELDDFVTFLRAKGANVFIPKTPSDVVELTPNNFDKVVKDTNTHRFVEFFAPWCGHCKRLAPEWEKLATAFKTEDSVVVAKLDADKHRDLASAYGISGFPTLKFFPKGKEEPEDFDGDRSLSSMVEYLNDKAQTFRTEDGKLNDNAGRLEKLDEFAKEFLSSASKDEVLKKAKEAVEQVEESAQKNAEYYVRVMKKAIDKGESYVKKEKDRLSGIINSGNAARDRLDSFKTRLNILKAF